VATYADQIRTDLHGRTFLDADVEKRLLRQGVNNWGLGYGEARRSLIDVSAAAGVALQSDVDAAVMSYLETQISSSGRINRPTFERAAALYRARSRDRVSLAQARSRIKTLMLQRNLQPARRGWLWPSRRWFDSIPEMPAGAEAAQAVDQGAEATPSAAPATQVLNAWAAAVNARNPQTVVALYAPSALLLATGSAEPRRGAGEIIGYFQKLLSYPQFSVAIDQPLDLRGVDPVVASGLYVFSWIDQSGQVVRVPARYSFAISRADQRSGGGARGAILMHHSSALPGSPGADQL